MRCPWGLINRPCHVDPKLHPSTTHCGDEGSGDGGGGGRWWRHRAYRGNAQRAQANGAIMVETYLRGRSTHVSSSNGSLAKADVMRPLSVTPFATCFAAKIQIQIEEILRHSIPRPINGSSMWKNMMHCVRTCNDVFTTLFFGEKVTVQIKLW